MLDSLTKRRIDTARDILVGKVPDPKSQVEQITIALIYKFMDDMDREAQELGGNRTFFSGDYEKYAWNRIFGPRLGGDEVLKLYTEALEKLNINPNVPQLFRDIFKNAYLPYRDPETLKSFLKIIDEFSYDHSERLGDAFEYLLSVLGSQGSAGQFRTPRHIIDFMVEVIEPEKADTILDPACGTAGFLISSYKHILKHNSTNFDREHDRPGFSEKVENISELTLNSKKYKGDRLTPDERNRLAGNITGYDISPDMVRLSLVNMYLHGLNNPNIFEYDTLTSEDHWNQYADVVLANPPFMSPKGGIRPHNRFSVKSNRSEVLFVDYMAEHLTPRGRAAVIVPEGIIFQSGKAYKQLRKLLVEEHLVGVISLPAGVFNPYSGVKTSILWLDKTLARKTDHILFVKVEHDGFDLGAQRRPIKENDLPTALQAILEYKSSLKNGAQYLSEPYPRVLVVGKSKIADNDDYNLSGERYRITFTINTEHPYATLNHLCEFNNGLWKGKDGPLIIVKVIRNTNFRKDGFIDWSEIAEIEVEKRQFENRQLQYGDIIIEKSGGGPTQPVGRVVFFNRNEQGYSYSNFTSRIRVINDTLNPEFLWHVLKYYYDKGETKQLQKQTSGIRNLDFDLYKRIQIPLPPLSVQEEIVSEIEGYQKIIDGARQVVENYKPRIKIDPAWEERPFIDFVIDIKLGLVKSKSEQAIDKPYPYIKMNNITIDGYLDLDNMVFVDANEKELDDLTLKDGDFIYNTRNSPDLVGKSAVYHGPNKYCLFNNNLLRIRFSKGLNSDFANWMINTPFGKDKIKKIVDGTTSVAAIYQKNYLSIKIPVPAIEIQKQIVGRIKKEQMLVNANKQLINLYEQKIKDRIAEVWGEDRKYKPESSEVGMAAEPGG